MGEEGVGHVLVEEGRGADEVEGYSVWTAFWHVELAMSLSTERAQVILGTEGSKRLGGGRC